MKKVKVLILIFSIACTNSSLAYAEEQEKPNILLILSDDHSVPHIGCYGDENCLKFNITPNLDSFAKESMMFTRAYAIAPQCAPNRISLFTGRSPVSTRTSRFAQPAQKDIIFFTDILRNNGYWVGLEGRSHHLHGRNSFPDYVGEQFEESDMFVYDRLDHCQISRTKWELLSSVPETFSIVIDEIPEDKPFFLYFGFNQPHRGWGDDITGIDPNELKLPADWPDLPEIREDYAKYLTELRDLDWGFGQIDSVLESRGLKENTIVIFMGDNGEALLRGKGTLYQRGINVPLIIRWPKKIKAQTVSDALISVIDFAPTLLDAAELVPHEKMTGVSFLPELMEKEWQERKYVFAERSWQGGFLTRSDGFDLSRTVISEYFQLIYNVLPDRPYSPADMGKTEVWKQLMAKRDSLDELFQRLYFQNPRPIIEIYDLKNDPFQLNNLSGKPEIKKIEDELCKELDKWLIREGDFVPIISDIKELKMKNRR